MSIKNTEFYEIESKKLKESNVTDYALKVLDFISGLGLTKEEALETARRAYILSRLDRIYSIREEPYTAVHVTKENIDFLEYREIDKTIP